MKLSTLITATLFAMASVAVRYTFGWSGVVLYLTLYCILFVLALAELSKRKRNEGANP